MWELDNKKCWVLKNWCFWTVVLKKTLESPLDCKEIKPVNPKGNESWIFIGRTDAEAEAPILWPHDAKNWLIGKVRDAGKDWGQEEKGMTEDEMVGWHHWLNGHEFEQAPVVGYGQGSLACCSPWGVKELDITGRMNWSISFLRDEIRAMTQFTSLWGFWGLKENYHAQRADNSAWKCWSLSHVQLTTPWTLAHQDPLSMRFLVHEYWSG